MDMKAFRMGRNTSEHYSSFEECAKAFGCRPVVKKTKDEKKLEEQKEKFCARHRCKACGEPMVWITGSVMTCVNEKCKGIKIEREDSEGNKMISYITSYDLLDDLGAKIADAIFS
jgi:hypothetical protein